MVDTLDIKDLEKELSGVGSSEAPASTPSTPQISPEEEIGFHKGALNTLSAERNELIKMVGNVEAIMQAHLKRLKDLGVEFK